jgi:hypothetical protein
LSFILLSSLIFRKKVANCVRVRKQVMLLRMKTQSVTNPKTLNRGSHSFVCYFTFCISRYSISFCLYKNKTRNTYNW